MYVLLRMPRAFNRSSMPFRITRVQTVTRAKNTTTERQSLGHACKQRLPRNNSVDHLLRENERCTHPTVHCNCAPRGRRKTACEQRRSLSASMNTSPRPSGSLAPLAHPKRAHGRGKRSRRFEKNYIVRQQQLSTGDVLLTCCSKGRLCCEQERLERCVIPKTPPPSSPRLLWT